jgi:hypothetical protein
MVQNADEDNISSIIDRLEVLSLQTNALVLELRAARLREQGSDARAQRAPPATPPRQPATFRHGYAVGDRAIITNRYLGQRNTEGRVTYVTEQRVTIVDGSGNLYTRKPSNLRRL